MRTLLPLLNRAISGIFALLFFLICSLVPALADRIPLRGKVVMEDGSAPDRSIGLERFCHDTGGQQVTQTDKKGNYLWLMDIDPLSDRSCVLRARFAGYDSTVIDINGFKWSSDPNLAPLVLRKHEAGG